jgi:histidine ammonia-lyase
VALEALCAAQALELRAPLRTAPATGAVVKRIRLEVPFMERDRSMAADLRRWEERVRTGELARAAKEMIGTLE